jgi:hypothetical protein
MVIGDGTLTPAISGNDKANWDSAVLASALNNEHSTIV